MLTRQELNNLCSPIKNETKEIDTLQIFRNVLNGLEEHDFHAESGLNKSLYFEAKTFLHGLLIVEDKISMAHSIETRLPFLDNDLVDFSMQLDIKHKLRSLNKIQNVDENHLEQKLLNLHKKSNDGKIILRKAMQRYLPEQTTESVKQGFSGPDASWFKGESIDFVRSELVKKSAPIFEYLDFEFTQKLLNEHFSGVKNRRLLIWSLLNLNKYIGANF